jgi:phosphatidate cytidylyltransferase
VSNALSRVLIAVVGLPIVIGAVYFGGWWLFALLAVAAALALHEFWLLARRLSPLSPAGYVGGILALVGAQVGGVSWMVGGALAALPLAFALKGISATKQVATTSISATLLGTVWIGCGLGFVILIRDLDRGRLLLLAVLLAVWAGDTFAYLGGRLLGRHKMAPNTSPGKTWEGFFFGAAATIFTVFVALYHDRHTFLPVWNAIVIGAVIAVAAPIGDLFESMLKRDAGVKDTGTLLGGHGGVLDRIDAILFAAPAAYYTIVALT